MDFPKSVPGVGLKDGVFADENPATGQQGSLMAAAWGNAVTEEILNVIRAAGLEPDEGDSEQLKAAIEVIAGDGSNVKKTSDTGVALLPEGPNAGRPAVENIPAGALLVRGNTQDPLGYRPEFYDRHLERWSSMGLPQVPAIPAEYIGGEITVTQPHLRKMVWNGAKYVRAPWHQPCQLFFSYDNPASIPGALPVRGDSVWQAADFPDVVERMGWVGGGTFSLVEARGEGVRILDNGRGVDAGRVLRSSQLDALQGHHHATVSRTALASGSGTSGFLVEGNNADYGERANVYAGRMINDGSGAVRSSHETRMRNIAFSLWMTI